MEEKILSIEKWDTRFWAVYEGNELVAVTVYRKGAIRVKERIEELRAIIERSEHDTERVFPGDRVQD
jgi:hypothetical protein